MNIRFLSLTCRRCGLVLLLLGLWLPLAAFGQAQSLGEFLDEQGRLAIPEGFSGSLDPEGFEMQTGADGAPRFVARGGGNVVPGEWQTFGGVNFGCNGTIAPISGMASDASGLLYLGGSFTVCGDTAANFVVAYDPDKNEFNVLGSGAQSQLNGLVRAVAVLGGDVYVGGDFSQAGGQAANKVARWDGSQWHPLGSGSENGIIGTVKALAISGSDVYVGGSIGQAGDKPASGVARWDGSEWHTLGNGVNSDGFLTVNSLAVSDGDVYVGGAFIEAGGQPANNIARWDGSQWHALEGGGQNGVNDHVSALAVSGSDLYVGGRFSEAGGQPASRVARWDGKQWHSLMGSSGQNGVQQGSVSGIGTLGDDVYVGGSFPQAGGVQVNFVTRWDGAEWHALESGGAVGVNNVVDSVLVSDGAVYFGGRFTRAGDTATNAIARWESGQWQALGVGGQNGVNRPVSAVAVSGDDIYVGGKFTWVGGVSANHVAKWDGSDWHALGSGEFNGVSSAGSILIGSLIVSGNDLYVGGSFNRAGTTAANNIALWDGKAWHTLGSGGQNGVDRSVTALAVSGSDVYVGGPFTEAGGQPANRVARWDGSAWHALGSGGQNGVNNFVSALAVSDSDLYVGGRFTAAGGQPTNRVARWDGSQWHALESGGQNGVNNSVSALAVSGSDVYVGGVFTEAGGQPANRVARWDGSVWHALGSGGQNGVNDSVSALAVSDSDLYVVGRFSEAGGQPANWVARWDGSDWGSLGSAFEDGVNQRIEALAIDGPTIHVGGSFSLAGGEVSSYLASFIVDPSLRISATPATVLVDATSEISVSGGVGSGAVSIEISSGGAFCSLSGTTLTALAEGECTVTATKAADAENPEQSDSILVRAVTDAGVNLVVEVDQLPSVLQLPGAVSRGQCDEIGFRIRVSNNGPLPADEVQVQMPSPSGLVSPVDWNCTIAGGQCTPDSGQGALDTTFSLAIGAAAAIDLAGCLDPNAAFVDLRVQGSLPDGTPLIFPGEAQVNWSVPVNNDGLFRSRFD